MYVFIVLIVLFVLGKNEFTIAITLLFSLEMIFKSFANLLNGSFQAFENTKYQGIGNTLMNTTILICVLISIYLNIGLYGIAASYILGNFMAFIYEYYVLNKYIVKPEFEFDTAFCKQITLVSIPFAITGIL